LQTNVKLRENPRCSVAYDQDYLQLPQMLIEENFLLDLLRVYLVVPLKYILVMPSAGVFFIAWKKRCNFQWLKFTFETVLQTLTFLAHYLFVCFDITKRKTRTFVKVNCKRQDSKVLIARSGQTCFLLLLTAKKYFYMKIMINTKFNH